MIAVREDYAAELRGDDCHGRKRKRAALRSSYIASKQRTASHYKLIEANTRAAVIVEEERRLGGTGSGSSSSNGNIVPATNGNGNDSTTDLGVMGNLERLDALIEDRFGGGDGAAAHGDGYGGGGVWDGDEDNDEEDEDPRAWEEEQAEKEQADKDRKSRKKCSVNTKRRSKGFALSHDRGDYDRQARNHNFMRDQDYSVAEGLMPGSDYGFAGVESSGFGGIGRGW